MTSLTKMEAVQALERARELRFETAQYARAAVSQFEERLQPAHSLPSSAAELVRLARDLGAFVGQTLTFLFDKTEEEINLVNLALRVESTVSLGEGVWQLALIDLGLQAQTLNDIVQSVRKSLRNSKHRAFKRLWRAEWDTRYASLSETLDDIMETIALGLNADIRQELHRELESLKRHTS